MTRLPHALLGAVVLLGVAASGSRAQIVVSGELSHDRAAGAGETYEEVVVLVNPTDEPQQAKLYLSDYGFRADGTNEYGAPGRAARSNAGWIGFAPPVVTLPPRATVPVALAVSVPAEVGGRAPAGSYWSMLMVEALPRGSDESTLAPAERGAYQFGVQERVRYGIQIATHVGALGAGEIRVVQAGLTAAEDGQRALEVDVENVGARMVDGRVYLDVFDAAGAAQGRIEGTQARLYPGTSFRHRVALDGLAPGTYEALLVIDGGEAGVFAAQYALEL